MKIKQIAAHSITGFSNFGALYALCEDGSLWVMLDPPARAPKWEPLPMIPDALAVDIDIREEEGVS